MLIKIMLSVGFWYRKIIRYLLNKSELVVIDEPPPPKLICEYETVVKKRESINISFFIIFLLHLVC